ncbi:MAG: DUF4097 domain-containing protein [Oscillospiraceae bacterium]|nr:DUF4097 domain-containing protein [Oscillospiraceae bacterium]
MNDKYLVISRLIIWILVAAIAIGILVMGLMGIFPNINIPIGINFGDMTGYVAGTGNDSVPAAGIDTIVIDWISGNVDVKYYTGSEIQIYEKASRNMDDREKMHYRVRGNELRIIYSANSMGINFSFLNNLSKSLEVLVPIDLTLLSIDVVSSKITVENMKTDILKCDTVSGSVTADNVTAKYELRVNTVSGKVTLNNTTCPKILKTDSVSGSMEFDLVVCPDSINTDTVSGSVKIYLPENDGFTARLDSVSGSLKCDFQSQVENKRITYKNGGANFRFDSVSGSVSIFQR